MNEESFGARVLVGTYSWAGVDYKGKFSVSDMTHINAAKCQHVILTHYCFVFFFFFNHKAQPRSGTWSSSSPVRKDGSKTMIHVTLCPSLILDR